MNAAALLKFVDQAGIRLDLGDNGMLRYSGDQAAIAQWLPEIRTHKAELLALLAANEPETGIRYASAAQLADDRRTCRKCRNLAGTRCNAAARGELPMTDRRYEPDPDRLLRCVGFAPTADDPDQRPGRERWPNLYRRLWATQEGGR